MATNPTVKKAVQTALEVLSECYPEDMQKLKEDPAKYQEVVQDATKVAEEEVNLQDTFSFLLQPGEQEEAFELVSKKLAEHLPSNRMEMIAKGLEIPTYTLSFRQESGSHYVDFSKKSGEKFMDCIQLSSAENILEADGLQIASIVVEVVGLVLSIVGIAVPEEVMAKVAQEMAAVIMESSAVKAAVAALQKVFNSGGSGGSKAKAIWEVIKAVWEYRTHGNILLQIAKALCSNMKWYNWMNTAFKITLLIAAAVLSDGAALIAKIYFALNSAVDFAKKFINRNQLEDIRKNL